MPVTHGVTGSSPVRTAKANSKLKQSSEILEFQSFFFFSASAKTVVLGSSHVAYSWDFLKAIFAPTNWRIYKPQNVLWYFLKSLRELFALVNTKQIAFFIHFSTLYLKGSQRVLKNISNHIKFIFAYILLIPYLLHL